MVSASHSDARQAPHAFPRAIALSLAIATSFGLSGCRFLAEEAAQAQRPARPEGDRAVAVETAIARRQTLDDLRSYSGTTQPARLVSLRAQTEGRLLSLEIDAGDAVNRSQVLGQIDDRLLAAELRQARAELAVRESEVAEAEAEVSEVEAEEERDRLDLQQFADDAERLAALAEEGAVSEQEAERARTAQLTAARTVDAAERRVQTLQRAVEAARQRVEAQAAAIAQTQQQQVFAVLESPISGTVMERLMQPGDLARPGEAIATIGDFAEVKVAVQVSELDLGRIRVGQSAGVTVDAFPDREYRGIVDRIAPAADATARLVPVEVRVPNSDRLLVSGLLARVQFESGGAPQIAIPEGALQVGGEGYESAVFAIEGTGEAATARAREVVVGDRRKGLVQIRSGLRVDEAIVVRSSQPLEDGQTVRLSILSEVRER
ncbi:MAG: efflux RND transporter periplasmic adaptor subunit [Cyanobacteria bacterium J06639_1]